ncbi:MAG: glycosyltransferase family 4 protein [bacterium]
MTVVEISECFPNILKPVTGEFILQHVRALSEYCTVITIVPLRCVPPKELISINLLKTVSGIFKWLSSQSKVKNTCEGNLSIIYFKYISLPRPYFESLDKSFIKFFLYKRLYKVLKKFNPDIIYCNWIRSWAELSSALARELQIPLIIDHHEDLPTLKKMFPASFKVFLNTLQKADGIVVHSSVNKKELMRENLNIPEARINYYGQNFGICISKKKFNNNLNNIICVSHLSERRKNIDDLIKAAALLKIKENIHLTIAGDGILKNEYISLTSDLELKSTISFKGIRTQNEINLLLDESDIFVLPSYPEAFGIVFIEALAKGLPLITCEGNGGGEELKQLGYPAILVKPNSPGHLAEAILNLLNDRDRMSGMSESGKQIVRRYFTWEKNAESTFGYLEECIKNYNK